jgi:hypothetical protein
VSVWVERQMEFDLTAAVSVTKHDAQGGRGNNLWPGVDFRIEQPSEWIWLEVKSWDPTHIQAKDRGGTRWSFICKMRSKVYTKEMRGKFLGTSAFLAWTNALPLATTRYVLLFQPPQPLDSALLGTLMTRLQSQIPNLPIWAAPITVSVLNLEQWNVRFPQYPARLL